MTGTAKMSQRKGNIFFQAKLNALVDFFFKFYFILL